MSVYILKYGSNEQDVLSIHETLEKAKIAGNKLVNRNEYRYMLTIEEWEFEGQFPLNFWNPNNNKTDWEIIEEANNMGTKYGIPIPGLSKGYRPSKDNPEVGDIPGMFLTGATLRDCEDRLEQMIDIIEYLPDFHKKTCQQEIEKLQKVIKDTKEQMNKEK